MIRYFTATLTKERKKEVEKSLTSLDRALLERASNGSHIVGMLVAGKPFINKYGRKKFATTKEVQKTIEKLVRMGLLRVE